MKKEFNYTVEGNRRVEKKLGSNVCLAKWYHSNIYFQTGETHSCYHPAPHRIELWPLHQDPSRLHNTREKFRERKQMLQGERPKGCQYCWNVENLGPDLISDRKLRNGAIVNEERLLEIQNKPIEFSVNPTYVEVSFGNECNFKCGYCHPKASSRFQQEIQQHGPYPNVKSHTCDIQNIKIYKEEENPYLEAWWKWWPALSPTLKTLRLTGGEPLIQKSTTKLLDFLETNAKEDLELNINSNLGSANPIMQRFCQRLNSLVDGKKIKFFKIFTSIDSWGSRAEYVRHGLDTKLFEQNVRTYLEMTKQPLNLMITFNLFAVTSFRDLLEKILEWRQEFPSLDPELPHRIRLDISYLSEPIQFDINLLPKEIYLRHMHQHASFMMENLNDNGPGGFSTLDYQKFLRILKYMENTRYSPSVLEQGFKDFHYFFQEYDKRKKSSLIETFPEMQSFFDDCRLSAARAPSASDAGSVV